MSRAGLVYEQHDELRGGDQDGGRRVPYGRLHDGLRAARRLGVSASRWGGEAPAGKTWRSFTQRTSLRRAHSEGGGRGSAAELATAWRSRGSTRTSRSSSGTRRTTERSSGGGGGADGEWFGHAPII